MLKMIKIIKARFCPNLGSRCVRIFNYAYAWLKPYARIFDDAYASFSTNPKSYILHDLIN